MANLRYHNTGREDHTLAVRSPGQLASTLFRSGFNVIFGSAVSGASIQPGLPLVGFATKELYSAVSVRLAALDDAASRAASAYAESLATGAFLPLRKAVKFEDAVADVRSVVGDARTADLLDALFSCAGEEFGPNHDALAALLEDGVLGTCYTTNFDNALELACPSIAGRAYIQGATPGTSTVGHRLVKLHGDVVRRTFVDTVRSLDEHHQRQTHTHIQDLAREHRPLLVLGYSGRGDVDVARHLRDLCQQIDVFWLTRRGERVPFPGARRISFDLHSSDPASNWLLHLANMTGHRPTRVGRYKDWRSGLVAWVDSLAIPELFELVYSCFDGRFEWPNFHIHQLARLQGGYVGTPIDRGQWLSREGEIALGVWASAVAAQSFALAAAEGGAFDRDWLDREWAFALWGMGDFDAALARLCRFTTSAPVTEDTVDAMSTYLFVAAEKICHVRDSACRHQLLKALDLDRVMELVVAHADLQHPRNRATTYATVCRVRRLVFGVPSPAPALTEYVEQLRARYDHCMDLQQFEAAWHLAKELRAAGAPDHRARERRRQAANQPFDLRRLGYWHVRHNASTWWKQHLCEIERAYHEGEIGGLITKAEPM